MMVRAGSSGSFKEGAEDLKFYAGVEVSATAVERVAESIGQDMERWSRGEARVAVEKFRSSSPAAHKNMERLYIAADGTGVPMTSGCSARGCAAGWTGLARLWCSVMAPRG